MSDYDASTLFTTAGRVNRKLGKLRDDINQALKNCKVEQEDEEHAHL